MEGASCLSPMKMGPFPIKRRVGNLAYKIDLPLGLHIHPIISVIHLEQAPKDEWERSIITTILQDVHQIRLPFKVKEILDKKVMPIQSGSKRKIWFYLIKYKDVRNTSDASYITLYLFTTVRPPFFWGGILSRDTT
ncbi:hypothetical protein TSTA_001390 [Talaromyces stipitatus ATCC 10500]|uniref:Tf2-1-like SH3-like domain-containing protein n=1 Tax=Talaromyces stipitatus (strain ATCC 10500 / CBS 375.48 / QM 6759 / NRRL 1006) TaxID=441959 RepID=B8MSI8_TALSN|nr:uncharacterized protein TSTA_001390 [Talaromyces stipitatus ATCC 10500]EED12068.1 hypothetical protein TSTA_001390 [Talaromyces stipitatus ATCC 10500]